MEHTDSIPPLKYPFEIHPCRETWEGADGVCEVERCALEDAEFLTIYRRQEDGTVLAVQDFPLSNIYGDVIINPPWE